MRWWSGTAHEQIVAAERAKADAFERAWREAEDRYRLLVEHVTAKEQPVARHESDATTEVIRARAGNHSALRRALGQYVKTARAQGVDEEVILKQLTVWPSSDDEGVDG